MRLGRAVSVTALLAGLALLAWAALSGQLSVHLVVVVPVVSGTGPAAAVGMLLVMGGLVGWVLTGSILSAGRPGGADAGMRHTTGTDHGTEGRGQDPHAEEASSETRGGGILLLGPIPIAWGSDRDSLLWLVVATIVLVVVASVALVTLR